jgi:hypothetical protein
MDLVYKSSNERGWMDGWMDGWWVTRSLAYEDKYRKLSSAVEGLQVNVFGPSSSSSSTYLSDDIYHVSKRWSTPRPCGTDAGADKKTPKLSSLP